MNQQASILKFGRIFIWIHLIGIIFSGLFFPLLSAIFHPQPAWQNAEVFSKAYHPIQSATFFCGYLLVLGSLGTFITLHALSNKSTRLFSLTALVLNAVFSVVVIINYLIQTTYVPYLATYQPVEAEMVLPVYSMANPGSLAWAFEMWGWGGIGFSFLLMIPILESSLKEKLLKGLFLLNAISSVLGAVLTSINMKWLFSPAGFASLIFWNLLVLAIDVILLFYISERERPLRATVR